MIKTIITITITILLLNVNEYKQWYNIVSNSMKSKWLY